MSQNPQGSLPPEGAGRVLTYFDPSSGEYITFENAAQGGLGSRLVASTLQMNDTIVIAAGPGSRDTDCPICRMEMPDNVPTAVHMTCGNVFCRQCLDTWSSTMSSRGGRSITCPMCRGVIGERLGGPDSDGTNSDDSDSENPSEASLRALQTLQRLQYRSHLIDAISQELLPAGGDIAGVGPYHWVALSMVDIELRLQYMGRDNFDSEAPAWVDDLQQAHLWAHWTDHEQEWDTELLFEVEENFGGAYPVFPFSPASMSQVVGIQESMTSEGYRAPTHPFPWTAGPAHTNYATLPLPRTNSPAEPYFDPETPHRQPPVIISPSAPENRFSYGQVRSDDSTWISMQQDFRELEAIMNWLRSAFSRCRRHIADLPRGPFVQAARLHRQFERYMGALVPNFLPIARFMEGQPEWWKDETGRDLGCTAFMP